MPTRQRQTVILSTRSRAASLRHELGTGANMSARTCCSFSGSRMRATTVPVAAEKLRPHPLQRRRCRPVRVEPQRTRADAPQWTQRFSACPRASIRARTSLRASSDRSLRRNSRSCSTDSRSTLAQRLRNRIPSISILLQNTHVL